MSQFYVAVIESNSEDKIFVTIPDLPGVNAMGNTEQEALALAIEFANDYVRDLVEDGHPVPEPHSLSEVERDPEAQGFGRALIPVEVPGTTVKISISIDEALLKRADRAAESEGLTRSAYIADALRNRLSAMRMVPNEERVSLSYGSLGEMKTGSGAVTNYGPMLVVPGEKRSTIKEIMEDLIEAGIVKLVRSSSDTDHAVIGRSARSAKSGELSIRGSVRERTTHKSR